MGCILKWSYSVFFESSASQGTLGKMMLGIKVVDNNLNRLSFVRANIRFACKFLSFILVYLGFITGFSKTKRALHDVIARTVVIKK
ncbi:MAG: RDD family protein [Synechococcaceae cyanobacterium RL_1_2]|nr:RDD family protein [Synechococcaceae cyanobacterium RL_1_2]